jgi:UDP-N-acetylmuramyl pentapeptide synthase
VFEQTVPRRLWNPVAWIVRLFQSEWRLHHYPYRVLVLELGTDHPGEIARYLRYIQPDIAVITAITPEHMENFPGGLDQVAAEELQVVATAKQVIACYDDIPAVYRHRYIDKHPGHHYFGLDARSQYRLAVLASHPITGTEVTASNAGKAPHHLKLKIFGEAAVKSAAAAYAVGNLLDVSVAKITTGLTMIRPMPGRMSPLRGVNGSIILDDTYNAQPDAVLAALRTLEQASTTGRRIALLGSMNELGAESSKYHAQVGAAAAGVDLLITIGEQANAHLGPAAVRAGLDPTRHISAPSPYAAGRHLALILTPGDVVLAKGSQNGVFAEEAVKLILADPADAAKLVRQAPAWLGTKARQFTDAP